MRGAGIAALVVLFAVLGASSVAVVAAPSPDTGAERQPRPVSGDGVIASGDDPLLAQERPSTDATVTRIRVHANGSATWVVEIRTLITNETDVADYRQFQERFRADPERYLGSFSERITRLVDRAGNVTGREMRATAFRATTRIEETPRRWGVVEYRFRWENFAADRNGTLVVGDVFQSGYYLTEGDSMVIEAPDGYAIDTVEPSPDDAEATLVRWVGPVDFADERPTVRFVERVNTETTDAGDVSTSGPDDGTDSTPAPTSAPTPTPDDPGESGGPSLLSLLGAALGLVLLGGVGVYTIRADPRDDDTPDDGPTSPEPSEDAGRPTDSTAPGEDDDPDQSVPAELLTDEERVVTLLERNGGRMRQSTIAEELEWSASKTSRVLSTMADSGQVDKLRLGNENVIDLPEDEN